MRALKFLKTAFPKVHNGGLAYSLDCWCWCTCSQVTSNEVSARVAQAEATEREIDDTREQYRPVACRASLLFFAISELAAVDPMYQYSLGWFLALFIKAIDEAPKVGLISTCHAPALAATLLCCLDAERPALSCNKTSWCP